jgi:hypothetical protein
MANPDEFLEEFEGIEDEIAGIRSDMIEAGLDSGDAEEFIMRVANIIRGRFGD